MKVKTMVGYYFTNINKANYSTCTTSHLKSLNTKKAMIYSIGNPGPGLGQAQKCGGVKP